MTSAHRGPQAALRSAAARVAALPAGLTAILAGRVLIALGLRRPPEGWRRTLGILLRGEPTRFALSAFGLCVPGATGAESRGVLEDKAVIALRSFLASQPDAHFRLEWRDEITIRHRVAHLDVALLRFASDGTLDGVTPYLAPEEPVGCADSARTRVHAAVVASYNRTRELPEVERPAALLRDVERVSAAAGGGAMAYARRLLSACCVSFEALDPVAASRRFHPPEFRVRRGLGFGCLTIVLRAGSDRGSVDIWVSAHHVGLDGVPLQDLVSALERTWGTAEEIRFPAPDSDRPFMAARACSMPGERDVEEIVTFVDFSPVLALRSVLNERYASEAGGAITFGALVAWLLTQEPEFAGVRVASTVDVAASGGYERDVDVVPLRPADFAGGAGPWEGLAGFATEFNRLIGLSRARTSPLRRQMQTAGLLPPWVHRQAVWSNPAALDDTFGSLCVTIIRDAKVFVAPMTDLGLGHGFIAIGNTNLPSVSGGRVTAVTIKGEPERIRSHAAVLRRVIERCGGYLAAR
jgi:hypothetical protein